MPGSSSSESAGAVERNASGSRAKAGGTEELAGRDFTGAPVVVRGGMPARVATIPGGAGAEKESGGASPARRKRYERSDAPSPITSRPAPSSRRTLPSRVDQSNSVHSIPYAKVAGVIK